MTETQERLYSIVEGVQLALLTPMPHHILVRWPGKKETKGGIIVPENRERLGLMNGDILLVGTDCDERLQPGRTIQFSMLCEKEFMGPQCPGDRDPVFFMRDEDVFGIVTKGPDGRNASLDLINGCVLTKPEIKPSEIAGLITVDRDAKTSFSVWGEVLQVDTASETGFNVGEEILYPRNMAEELRLGDFEADLMHVVRVGLGGKEIEAVREKVRA